MKTGIIIQARMHSLRLPGKTMATISGKPSLWHLLARVKKAQGVDKIIVATTTNKDDKNILTLCKEEEISCFRGNEEDVLGRYISCAKEYQLDVIIRVTADNPLTDPSGIECLIDAYNASGADYIHNNHQKGWPFGTFAELVTLKALSLANNYSDKQQHREHVTAFIREHPEQFKLLKVNAPDYLIRPNYYLTIDYPADLKLMRIIYQKFYNGSGVFSLRDVIAYLDENPSLVQTNAGLHQGISE